MWLYAVDLGTTNIKVVLFDAHLRRLAVSSAPLQYSRHGKGVEFSPADLFDLVIDLVWRCAAAVPDQAPEHAVIVLTGQAESLVLNDSLGEPVRPGLSWLDERASTEAVEIGAYFGVDEAFAVTGEPSPSSTWPAAKLRWLARHEPEALAASGSVLMMKDDIVRRLTGTAVGEATTRGFTYLYDVRGERYWDEMLEFVSVAAESLPPVVAAGTDVGEVLPDVARRLPPARSYRVNVGALDHFCAMVGTGSYTSGVVSESAGTVLSLSLLTTDWSFEPSHKVSFHAGLRTGEVVLFNGVDSGGVSLEWFRRELLAGLDYPTLEEGLQSRNGGSAPLFLPYLTGVNPPDYFPHARGAFLDLELGHDRFDMAFAVEEGVAHLLRRNIDYLTAERLTDIVSTGGGASSAHWNQLKADVCGVDLVVPDEREATCRGAAALALVAAGELGDVADAALLNQPQTRRYRHRSSPERAARYRRFDESIQRLFVADAQGALR